MKENQNDDKQNNVIGIVITLSLILLVFGVTFAVMAYTKPGTRENSIKTGSITFNYTETSDGIQITDAEPISDEEGKHLPSSGMDGIVRGYFDFSVTATMTGKETIYYNICGIDISDGVRKLDPKYVKVYLTNGDAEIPKDGYQGDVPTFDSLDNIEINNKTLGKVKGKKLYQGTFSSSRTDKFRLRIWVSKDYPETAISETFKMRVDVDANT